VTAAVFEGLDVGCKGMVDLNFCEKASDVRAFLKINGFKATDRQLAEWAKKGLLQTSRQVRLGRGKGTVTCYPSGTMNQALDVMRLKCVYGRNFPMIGWMLAMGGYEVDQRYWKDPVQEVMADWTSFEELLEVQEDGSVESSEMLYDIAEAPDSETVLRRSPIWPVLKRMRPSERGLLFRVIANVRAGQNALTGTWDDEEARKDKDILGLALGLRQPHKKRKSPLLWDGRQIETDELLAELNRLAEQTRQLDVKQCIENAGDEKLLLGLRRVSLLVWLNRDRIVGCEHGFTKATAILFYRDKPKRHAALALLGAYYFGLIALEDSQTDQAADNTSACSNTV
jgi:hypothetical protein